MTTTSHASFGFTVCGSVDSGFRTMQAMRSCIKIVRSQQYRVNFFNIPLHAAGKKNIPFLDALLLFLPIEAAHQFILQYKNRLKHTIICCIPFWELPHIPAYWKEMTKNIDFLLAPSRFTEAILTPCNLSSKIVHFPQTLFLPENVKNARERYGIDKDSILFMLSFDITSDLERINPKQAIEAFTKAFTEKEHVRLLIKIQNSSFKKMHKDRGNSFISQIKDSRNVRIIFEKFPYHQLLGLYVASDIFVSLHRSKSTGFNCMEAMQYGKPVIATGYSGNCDFMNNENSSLVSYSLVPAVSSMNPYILPVDPILRTEWAEPSLDECITYMRILAHNPSMRETMGLRAKQSMTSWHDQCSQTDIFRKIVLGKET